MQGISVFRKSLILGACVIVLTIWEVSPTAVLQ